jgi:hypothetical protein
MNPSQHLSRTFLTTSIGTFLANLLISHVVVLENEVENHSQGQQCWISNSSSFFVHNMLLDTTIPKQTQIMQIRYEPFHKQLEVKMN